MQLSLLINILKINGVPVSFKVSKGEIIYLKYDSKSQELFDLLLKPNLSRNSEGQILDHDLNVKLTADKLSTIRQQIGYVDPEAYFESDKTIEDNANFYLMSLDIDREQAMTRFESYRKDLNIKRGVKVKDLQPIDVYCFKIALVLAKNPRILLLENPFSQLDPSTYLDQMDTIYNLIRKKGITHIASVSDQTIMQAYPGRYIEM